MMRRHCEKKRERSMLPGKAVRAARVVLASVLIAVCLLPMTARADTGPKPSVSVTVKGRPEEEQYYATLLSERDSTGPAFAYDGGYARYQPGEEGYEIWKTFVEYEDSDGFYFLQEFWECSGSDTFRWGYYPPAVFKILLYFPATDSFAVSGIQERYAFDSYFEADLTGMVIAAPPGSTETGTVRVFAAQESYDYTLELLSLAARILCTILLEVAAAWLFGLRSKRQILFLTAVNVGTQMILNVLLNLVNYRSGQYAFVAYYLLLELVVLTLEALLYGLVLTKDRFGAVSRRRAVCYAAVANVLSFAAGLWIAHLIPGIF